MFKAQGGRLTYCCWFEDGEGNVMWNADLGAAKGSWLTASKEIRTSAPQLWVLNFAKNLNELKSRFSSRASRKGARGARWLGAAPHPRAAEIIYLNSPILNLLVLPCLFLPAENTVKALAHFPRPFTSLPALGLPGVALERFSVRFISRDQ